MITDGFTGRLGPGGQEGWGIDLWPGGIMADSWFYRHEGKTYGPAPSVALRLLAAGGKLAPTDLVWNEGHSPATAVPAGTVIPFSGPGAPRAVPDWLADVRA